MNKLLLAGSMAFSMTAFSQTTLFQDDFEAGGGNWTLNGGSGQNEWIVNAEYTGFSGFIDDTPDQPAGITGFPNSYYMHIYNPSACSGLGICNASFDTGSSSDQPTQLTSSITTTGYGTVTLSFWYLCDGAAGSAYGTIEYSLDGGTTWTPTGTSYQGVATWTQATVTNPAWANVAALKFRFRWQNGASGNDPAFAIDQLKVSGMSGSFAAVDIDGLSPTSWCFNSSTTITVNFTSTGTINSGNIYTVQLSNAAGSFASPVNIGTMAASTAGSFATNATIPAGTPIGTGYRIRVNASNPATTGSDNGTDIAVHAQPTINVIGNPADGTMCPGQSVTMLASGGVSYSWLPASSVDNPTQAQVVATPASTTPYTVTGTDANGCVNTATFVVTVQSCTGISEEQQLVLSLYPNPVSETVYLQYDAAAEVQNIEILDYSGRVVSTIGKGAAEINTAALSTGSYLVRLTHANGTSTARFVKQ